MLIREHAEIVVADTVIAPIFEQHCKDGMDLDLGRVRHCFSDEHYIGTLLAMLGRQSETDCTGFATHVDWVNRNLKTFHPRYVFLVFFCEYFFYRHWWVGHAFGPRCRQDFFLAYSFLVCAALFAWGENLMQLCWM